MNGSDFTIDMQMLDNGAPLIVIAGRMMGQSLWKQAQALLDRYAAVNTTVFVDLSACVFFSSAAFSCLHELANQRHSFGKDLVVIGASQQIRQVICLMNLDPYFTFIDTPEEAGDWA
ncbi:hypothetical protein FACS1894139_00650 [Planctomycetales bacterium]|nr:hypothetical protein FACS1894107_01520 [Planctomycetales bacterium]GHS99330.1 hypothetical protein FACS1894108_09100 [Planctomycetales bacterium]GHT02455.1 hypothetical protein FACS1894139_00650 [Planctomycetales bacterium]